MPDQPYATKQDIIAREPDGERALVVLADQDGDGVADDSYITGALEDAADVIDGHLSTAGYTLPLPTVPRLLRVLCVDLAVWQMAKGPAATDDRRRRQKDAMRMLERIAGGSLTLGLPTASAGEARAPSRASFAAAARRFGRGRRRVEG